MSAQTNGEIEKVEAELVETNMAVCDEGLSAPISLQDGFSLLTIDQQQKYLADYVDRRNYFNNWLKEQLIEGVHFGYPPSCNPSNVDPKRWQSKPSLYKAGALFIADLLQLRAEFKADKDAWEQMGSEAGVFVIKCLMYDRKSGTLLGEGHGEFKVGTKKMKEGNSAIKMAEKRAMVNAVISTVPACADLFTQDEWQDKKPATLAELQSSFKLKVEKLREGVGSDLDDESWITKVLRLVLGYGFIRTEGEMKKVQADVIDNRCYDLLTGDRTKEPPPEDATATSAYKAFLAHAEPNWTGDESKAQWFADLEAIAPGKKGKLTTDQWGKLVELIENRPKEKEPETTPDGDVIPPEEIARMEAEAGQ